MNIDDMFGRGHGYINDSWVRPFLIQSDLLVENGRFVLKPKSGLLTQLTNDFVDSTVFDLFFRLGGPAEKHSTGSASRKTYSKTLHICLFNPSLHSSHN